jgi:pimeloyl-ACP methyl ester carboxylesterase
VELLFLHALPLDGSMWTGQQGLLPGATHAPTLYGFGNNVEVWAAEALRLVKSDRLIVVGCSVGGSCAVEVALAAPDRIAALVLIGTKVGHRPEPNLHASALQLVREEGLGKAWSLYWEPLFSKSSDAALIARAKSIALRQTPENVAKGITAFHTRKARDGYLARLPLPMERPEALNTILKDVIASEHA